MTAPRPADVADPAAPTRAPRPGDGALLRRFAGDWRSILEGTSIGLMQLMLPPLGAAVAAQSGFFDDPYGRIWRSIPQIWATILAPDADERGRRIRDLHRGIKGEAFGERYTALDPETYWWAHATFTHLVLRSVERYHRPGTLDDAGWEHLYADTVAWYERYGVTMKPVPATLAEFRTAFDRFCHERLERTPAVERLVGLGESGEIRQSSGPLAALRPLLDRVGRLSTVGNLPPVVRERLGFTWSDAEQARLDRLALAYRLGFEAMPGRVNRATFELALRRTGSATRADRYVPLPRGDVSRRPAG